MNVQEAYKLINDYAPGHSDFVHKCLVAERYYRNENDIVLQPDKTDEDGNPLRSADNRISHNFHGLLVDQKASYLFTAPPLFDVGSTSANQAITEALGNIYAKTCTALAVNAANCGIAWIHYWTADDGSFKYSSVDPKQVVPVWTDDLTQELKAVMRIYRRVSDDGKTYEIYEIWTETECSAWQKEIDATHDQGLKPCMLFSLTLPTGEIEGTNIYTHDYGRVPFIPFGNNAMNRSDLVNIKGHIDIYDKVYSGFVNDLEDIQELIFVLSGYGGTNLAEFMQDLKRYKAIKLDADDTGRAGVETISIQIPVEARKELLTVTRKEIFEQGQGVDPQPEDYGNSSGVALKFMYALLELKAGMTETEFRLGFGELIRAICDHRGISCSNLIQTWTRTSIRNEKEISEICSASVGIISEKSILKNHPYVEDAEAEEKQIQKEKDSAMEQYTAMTGTGDENAETEDANS